MLVEAVAGAGVGVQQIEEYTDAPVEELEEDELDAAISELGIQEEPLSDSDQAALDAAG